MPQLGSRVRDPIQHEDGSIWYAGQYGNLVGRLDPATGQAKEWQLPAGSMPHTVQLDNKGRPWFSGNKNGTVGRLDPATGQSTVYKMPDPKSDPHTLAFNKDGILFFSFQASNLIGRLNPETGESRSSARRTRSRSPMTCASRPTAPCGCRAMRAAASSRSTR